VLMLLGTYEQGERESRSFDWVSRVYVCGDTVVGEESVVEMCVSVVSVGDCVG
jgi:hypothetical protein